MIKRRNLLNLAAALCLGCGSTAVPTLAQTIVAPTAGSACGAPVQAASPKPPGDCSGQGLQTGSLSSALAKSQGTIKPPTVADPSMVRPAPNTGHETMPVIAPPGSPNGNQTIIPK